MLALYTNNFQGTLTQSMSAIADGTVYINTLTNVPAPTAGDWAYIDIFETDINTGAQTRLTNFKYTGTVDSGVAGATRYSLTGVTRVNGDNTTPYLVGTKVECRLTAEGVREFARRDSAGSLILPVQTATPATPSAGSALLEVRTIGNFSTVIGPPHAIALMDANGREHGVQLSQRYSRAGSWSCLGLSFPTVHSMTFSGGGAQGTFSAVGMTSLTTSRGRFTGTRYTTTAAAGQSAGLRSASSVTSPGIHRSTQLNQGGGSAFLRWAFDSATYGLADGCRMACGVWQVGVTSPETLDLASLTGSGVIFGGDTTDHTGPTLISRSATSGAGGVTRTPLTIPRTWAQLAGCVYEMDIWIGSGDGTNAGAVWVRLVEFNNTDFTSVELFKGQITGQLPSSALGANLSTIVVVGTGTLTSVVTIDCGRGEQLSL